MMFPQIFAILSADSGVQTEFGAGGDIRVYPGKLAPQTSPTATKPGAMYATYFVVNGTPENYVGDLPDIDTMTVQFSVFAGTLSEVDAGATAIRDALESAGHMTRFDFGPQEPDTRLYTGTMDFDFWTQR